MYSNGAIGADKQSEPGYVIEDYRHNQSPKLQQLSDDSDLTLVHKQQTTRQITTVTKVVHEVQHISPDECMIDYVTMPYNPSQHTTADNAGIDYSPVGVGIGSQFLYNNISSTNNQGADAALCVGDPSDLHSQYTALQEFGYPNSHYVTKSPALTTVSRAGPQCTYRANINTCGLIGSQDQLTNSSQKLHMSGLPEHALVPQIRYMPTTQYGEMPEYGMSSANCAVDPHYVDDAAVAYGYVSDANYGLPGGSVDANSRSFENHSDLQSKMSQLTINPLLGQMRDPNEELLNAAGVGVGGGPGGEMCPGMRWRDPNLSEVISFLNNPNNAIKANAAAYLQHLCYMDDPNKQRTRTLGGIPPLVRLLSYDVPEIHKNACGALRNLSYGRQNDENKRAIRNAGGITALVNLLCRTQESEVKELVTGVLWNMSSCEDIKRSIIDEALVTIVNNIMKPHSGWDPVCPGDTCYSTVFRNASGVLRNVSSAGEYARSCLRNSDSLVECLLYVVKTAIEKKNIGNKTVENCVCILRNLSYRCQEVEDPNYDKQPLIASRALSSSKGENLGCFGTGKKKKDAHQNDQQLEGSLASGTLKNSTASNESFKTYEKLWQPEVVQYYLALLQSCSNPETLEAAAGAIQNLSACYWQPSIDIRATVRKEKGLPILVELLRMEVDRVVCAVATALRNLAIDQRNKELIGKYAMRDLVQKLPSGNPQHDHSTSDDTISAVLATINEVIKKNPEFSRSLLDAGGVERLMNITRQRQKYTSCVLKFASQVLFTMWQHHELRDVYKKNGWKEQDFVTKSIAAQNASPNSPSNANNTLNRPMASQGRTRYEDRTIQRSSNNAARSNGAAGHIIRPEPSQMLSQMVDDPSMNGVTDDGGGYQRDTQNLGAMYNPIMDSGRDHSN